MEIRKHLFSIAIATLLLSNILLTGVSIANQASIVDNQVLIAGHVDSLTDYVATLGDEVKTVDGQQGRFNIEIHMKAIHRDPLGKIISISSNAGVLTTGGKNTIEGWIGNNASTASAQFISLSNSDNPPQAAWTGIPAEIAANNLTRIIGAYTSTGDGVHTIVKTFTASGAQSAQLSGLNWAGPNPGGNGTLLCADQMTAVSMENLDTLEITWTITIT